MKRKTPEEQHAHTVRERLVAYYVKRKKLAVAADPKGNGGKMQQMIASEIPLSIGTLNPILQRQKPLRGATTIVVEHYLERMEA